MSDIGIMGAKVEHIRLGEGKVSGLDENYVTVTFKNKQEKTFQYPASFEKFLTCKDEKTAVIIGNALEEFKKAKAQIEAEKQNRIQALEQHLNEIHAEALAKKEKAAKAKKARKAKLLGLTEDKEVSEEEKPSEG